MARSPDALSPDLRDALLQHLTSVYALAQSVSPHAEAASHLTAATFQQAFEQLSDDPQARPESMSDKQWLFHLLMQVRRATPAEESATPPVPLYALRHQLAGNYVERTFPRVFATLPGGLRVLLLLCEVEGLSCAEAGQILGLSKDEACERLKQARTAAESSLRNEATLRERHLLDTSLAEDWLRTALRRTVAEDLASVPPTLVPILMDAAAQPVAPPQIKKPEIHAPEATPTTSRAVHIGFAALLILTAGLIGYVATTLLERAPETNLIVLSAQQADTVNPILTTTNPGQAEAFVQEQLQWRLTLPSIEGATLHGVGILDITSGASVPVFLYQDDGTEASITLYAYTYALLNRNQDQIQLAPDILRQIETDRHFDLHDLGEQKVLVWRSRDDIFVAVTTTDAATLRERIVFPS